MEPPSTILTEYLRGAQIKPSARLATALAYGIKTDTSLFQRPALAEDLSAFQYLFPKVNQSVLRKIDFSEMRLKDLDIIRKALERRVVRKNLLFAHMGQVASPDVLVQIADFFSRVDSADISAVSGVHDDKVVVIMRNMAKRSNAGKHMEQSFGSLGAAGGHKTMARAEMPLSTLKQVLGDINGDTPGQFRATPHPAPLGEDQEPARAPGSHPPPPRPNTTKQDKSTRLIQRVRGTSLWYPSRSGRAPWALSVPTTFPSTLLRGSCRVRPGPRAPGRCAGRASSGCPGCSGPTRPRPGRRPSCGW